MHVAPQLQGSFPAVVLFDIRAAFPSVAWEWIWLVLSAIGALPWLIVVVRLLYDGSVSDVLFGGVVSSASFPIQRGILQGFLASGSLWAILFDPIVRTLAAAHPEPGGSLTAFADDLVVAFVKVSLCLRPLMDMFMLLPRATFCDACLGRYSHRCAAIRASSAHLQNRMTRYSVYCRFVLMCLCQLSRPDARIRRVEAATFASLLAAPMNAVTPAALSALSVVRSPLGARTVEDSMRAASIRLALRTNILDGIRDRISVAVGHDDALLVGSGSFALAAVLPAHVRAPAAWL